MTTHADENERMAALKRLYDSLPETERKLVDADCKLVQQLVVSHMMGPKTAFEVVMKSRQYLIKLVTR